MEMYFTQYFGVDPEVLDEYGAFDISVVSDLPLFIDPFLLFNSEKAEYQTLHDSIIDYLKFLRDKTTTHLDYGMIDNWYRFSEVRQNWLGFTAFGNGGSGLGKKFARALHGSLSKILADFGEETITESSHLEKVCLVSSGVGRDNISDFTTNLIKHYLLEYTQAFTLEHIDAEKRRKFMVRRARFNYETETWETRPYVLPRLRNDFVLLTPMDMLTCDDTWINHAELVARFELLPAAIEDAQLRSQINNYFRRRLGRDAKRDDRIRAVHATIMEYPELLDAYIKKKEETGDEARAISAEKTSATREVLVEQVKAAIPDLERRTNFYKQSWTSYEEARERVLLFKHYVEHKDGYRLINRGGEPFSRESDVQLFFGLIWCKTDFDVNREPNNGRGPVDFKVSFGSGDKSLIEFKLASNSKLKRNLQKQVEIYEQANQTRSSLKVVVCYTERDQERIAGILEELGLSSDPSIVVIDARSDNKPSASTA